MKTELPTTYWQALVGDWVEREFGIKPCYGNNYGEMSVWWAEEETSFKFCNFRGSHWFQSQLDRRTIAEVHDYETLTDVIPIVNRVRMEKILNHENQRNDID